MKLLSLSLNPMFYSLAAQPPTVALSGEAAFSFWLQTFWLHIVPAWRCIKSRRSRGPKGRLKEGEGQGTRGAGQSRLNSSVLARWGWEVGGGLAGRWNRRLNVWRRISWAISLYWRGPPDQLIFCTDCEPSSTSAGPREPTQCPETRCNKPLLKIRIHRQIFSGDKERLMSWWSAAQGRLGLQSLLTTSVLTRRAVCWVMAKNGVLSKDLKGQ